MKKFLKWLVLPTIIFGALWFIFAPPLFEKSQNVVDGKPLPPVSEAAYELHRNLTIVDLHADTLLWKRKLTTSVKHGHVDLERLQDGNVALQIFSSVTKTPRGQNYDSNSAETDNITILAISQLQPVRTWFSLIERQLWHAQKLKTAVIESDGALEMITAPGQLDGLNIARQGEKKPVGALFSAEGLQALEGKRENMDRLYDSGMRMAGLVHFFDNELAGSMHGEEKKGLTDFGRQIVRDMEDKGMIVDIAHASHNTVADILKMARRPVVSSHGGIQAICKVNRNLTDAEIRGVAATGGVIGLGYWDGAMCDTDPKSVARSVVHIRDLVGIDYIALGSDFDGNVTTRFDTSGLVHVTQALMDAGLTNDEIRAVMGGNAMRVIKQGIAPMPKPRQ